MFLPKAATLGVYRLQIVKLDRRAVIHHYGSSNFRVEEYKKPEFEVKVEAPKEPVKLGDKITATIEAQVLLRRPGRQRQGQVQGDAHQLLRPLVSDGPLGLVVRQRLLVVRRRLRLVPRLRRMGHPAGRCRPGGAWSHEQPEIVLENEVPVGPDGKVEVVIDTAMAKELHGNQDHKYTITAEVTDQSRRTIVGTGDVLVRRKPFKVYTWLDKGHYRTDDTIKAHFNAQTLDQKPVAGQGRADPLRRSRYNDKAEPVEKAVETWKLDTNAEG